MNKYNPLSKKTKLLLATIVAMLAFLIAGGAVIAINNWFEHNRLIFHSPIEIAFFQPVKVEERKPEIIVERFALDYPGQIDTPIKKYICDKWGPYDCKTALAVFTAESGLREDAIHPNNNGTVDFGIAQINSIHFKRPGCSLKDVVDQYKNVDCAHSIWLEQGFQPWVGFTNGNFKAHL